VSADGSDIKKWLVNLSPRTLSVTASRLVVTLITQLMVFDSDGNELRCVSLPDYIAPLHAMEVPTGILVVSHINTKVNQHQVSIVYTGGQLVRPFTGLAQPPLDSTPHMAVDSLWGNIILADRGNRRIVLLSDKLELLKVIIDERQLNYEQPVRLCYLEQSGQLLVGLAHRASVAVFCVKDLMCVIC